MKSALYIPQPSVDLEALVNAFPRRFYPAGYVGLTVLAVLTATCTSEPVPTDRSATQLAFTVNPGSAVAGEAFTPAVVVEARDASERLASSFTGTVTVEMGANPAGATLSGGTTADAVGGVATFSTLTIHKSAAGYTLVAAAAGLTEATSAAFNVAAGPAAALVCTGGPTLLQVTAVDDFGNTVTSFTGAVTAVVSPGGDGATTLSAVAGVATFSMSIPSGSTVVATSGGLTVTCGPF